MATDDKCVYCGELLARHETVWAVGGLLFCSDICAGLHRHEEIVAAAADMAAEWVVENAEEVRTDDIGIR